MYIIYIYLKDFVWEDQREKLCYISHTALETHLECYIASKVCINKKYIKDGVSKLI